MLSSFN